MSGTIINFRHSQLHLWPNTSYHLPNIFANPFHRKTPVLPRPAASAICQRRGGGGGRFSEGARSIRIGIAAKSCHCRLLIYIHAEILRQDSRQLVCENTFVTLCQLRVGTTPSSLPPRTSFPHSRLIFTVFQIALFNFWLPAPLFFQIQTNTPGFWPMCLWLLNCVSWAKNFSGSDRFFSYFRDFDSLR